LGTTRRGARVSDPPRGRLRRIEVYSAGDLPPQLALCVPYSALCAPYSVLCAPYFECAPSVRHSAPSVRHSAPSVRTLRTLQCTLRTLQCTLRTLRRVCAECAPSVRRVCAKAREAGIDLNAQQVLVAAPAKKRVFPRSQIWQSTWRAPEFSAVGILVRKVGSPFLLVAASLGPIDQAGVVGGRDNWRNAFSSRNKMRE
jgi:hypothetical protein